MDGWLGAPFGGEAADGLVGGAVEAEEVADDVLVEQGAVRVCVRDVGGLEFFVPELLEDVFRFVQLVVAQGAEVEHRQRFDGPDGNAAASGLLSI